MKRNAIIMAAGTSSRFVPISYERPKGLLEVKGEILIERQIRQLREAGINDITIVVGYKADMFQYLVEKYDVSLVYNNDYAIYNNTSSVIRVLDKLSNTFICSSDNYFPNNVFMEESGESYYSALYAAGQTSEYCITTDEDDFITDVTVGGHDSWYMIGHVYFNEIFSKRFSKFLEKDYEFQETKLGYWEDVYIRHIKDLPMKIRRYGMDDIAEFDNLDELRLFDNSYIKNTRSSVIKNICRDYGWQEEQLSNFTKKKITETELSFCFSVGNETYIYDNTQEVKVERK